MVEWASRLKKLPPYLFAELDEKKAKKIAEGVDVIDMGVGDPDLPTPTPIVEAMKKAVEKPEHHKYPTYNGMKPFREAVAKWYKKRFNVALDPDSEVVALIGSKEGIAHLPFAFVEEKDVVLVPDPGYPVYHASTVLAGGEPYHIPLKEELGFLPDISSVPKDILERTKVMFLNYPNNPTAGIATKEAFQKLVELAKEYNFIIAHDAAYSEIYYEEPPISILEIPGAKEVAIEFHSLSKTFNMTGWRIGMAVGNAEILKSLLKVKTNIDSGVFQAIQEAAIFALENEPGLKEIRNIYKRRIDIFVNGLKKCGFEVEAPKATFYVWFKVPPGYTSMEFANLALEKAGVLLTPGVGFGVYGERFVRAALCMPDERIEEAANRLSSL
ncbi:LL-diaminopimelate aminotransferase [Thermosulfidibacter takaii ABI70S6]|uniref:Aminotransferase n=1 Tax=Thermosulfidibacter takaii (strain DSM 17441 / JCM 13301 / NBRC 103674 / ABI70S6) TaxID=1298851 RepID=A0A0S3QT34_THET7|nr:LL-diaminopimelate aminotransferase [Thermosulfidibacter takaii]BAT71499.1 LL-diaminopimelate aminotransferase [Thermosulfidibacter takaii ABI70S6]